MRSCPISFEKIDATKARLSAFTVLLLTLLALFTLSWFIALFLFLDFGVRLARKPQYSVALHMATLLQMLLGIPSRTGDAAAKRVAAYFGLTFSLLLLVGIGFSWMWLVWFVGGMLILCSALELFFDYCVGCQVYTWYLTIKEDLSR